ncbi:MAG: hypothetical protein HW374_1245 [Bacteroidetes bacterium]|nr:hypothetical protein [Bacteroidota bacterium]
MPHQTLKGKTAVGFFVDGLQLKYVQLSLTSGKVILRDFKTVSLETKLEKKTLPLNAPGSPTVAGDEGAFGVADAIAAATEEVFLKVFRRRITRSQSRYANPPCGITNSTQILDYMA